MKPCDTSGHPLQCHNQPACILQSQRDWDRSEMNMVMMIMRMMMMVRFEAMAAIMEAAGRSRVNKRYSVDAEFDFGNIPEKFYGFHDDYKRYPDIYL